MACEGGAESDMELDLLGESESDSDESTHSHADNASIQRSAVTAATAGSDAGLLHHPYSMTVYHIGPHHVIYCLPCGQLRSGPCLVGRVRSMGNCQFSHFPQCPPAMPSKSLWSDMVDAVCHLCPVWSML